jgi:hypothetical protein
MFGPLGLSLAPYVNSSRTLSRWVKPIAIWYSDVAGYRKYGFKYDDLCTRSESHLAPTCLLTFRIQW